MRTSRTRAQRRREWLAPFVALLLVLALAAACGSGKKQTPTSAPKQGINTGASPSVVRATSPVASSTATSGATRGSPTTPRAASQVASPTGRAATTTATTAATVTSQSRPSPTARSATATRTPRPVATQAPTATQATTEPTQPAATTTATGTVAGAGQLTVTEQGFGQVEGATEVGYAFVVANPLLDAAIESSAVTITAYDAAGATLQIDESVIDLVLPGETLGIGGSLFVSDGASTAKVEVRVATGVTEALPTTPNLTTAQVNYFGDDSYPFASGVVTNPFPAPLQDVEVYAVLRDAAGQIVGGGYGYLDFVPANGQAGAAVYVAGGANPAKVDFYATITQLTIAAGATPVPRGAQDIALTKSGWGASPDNSRVGYAFVLQNPNTDQAIQDARYQVTYYDADGRVLATQSDSVAVLLPGEALGVAGTVYLPATVVPARAEIQALAGAYGAPPRAAPYFTTADATYVADMLAPAVTGAVTNNAGADLNDVAVYAIAYDANGQIIGGGATIIDTIPAGGQTPVEVEIVAQGEPASVELYAAPSTLTELGE